MDRGQLVRAYRATALREFVHNNATGNAPPFTCRCASVPHFAALCVA
jgi:hypothetical protein